MREDTKDAVIGIAAFFVLCAILVAGMVYFSAPDDECIEHQDAACFSPGGTMLFFAQDVTVNRRPGSIAIIWPDGRTRELVNGSCEWGPTDPNHEYEDTQSWKGEPEDRSERNA
jgi:hypothetical protein